MLREAIPMPCPVCQSSEVDNALLLHDWAYSGQGPFAYLRCRCCGALYAAETLAPAEWSCYYPATYAAYVGESPRSGLRALARDVGLRKRCRAVEQLASGEKLLDVGCGAGTFVKAMQARGWQAQGLEQDAGAAQAARARGLDVYTGRAPGHPFAPASFDVITLWDVIEHLEQPREALREIGSWLTPGGWLVLRTPDAASLQARFFGFLWAGYDAPRHRVIYTLRALEDLLRESGLEPRLLRGLSGRYPLAVLSLQNGAQAGRWPPWLARAAGHPLGQALSLLPLALLDAVAGGAELLVAAQRPYAENHPKG